MHINTVKDEGSLLGGIRVSFLFSVVDSKLVCIYRYPENVEPNHLQWQMTNICFPRKQAAKKLLNYNKIFVHSMLLVNSSIFN